MLRNKQLLSTDIEDDGEVMVNPELEDEFRELDEQMQTLEQLLGSIRAHRGEPQAYPEIQKVLDAYNEVDYSTKAKFSQDAN